MADVVVGARCSKTARLRASHGASDFIYSTSNDGLVCPLGPGNFDKNTPTTRMNLEVPLDDEDDLAFFDGLDESRTCRF